MSWKTIYTSMPQISTALYWTGGGMNINDVQLSNMLKNDEIS